MMTYSCHPVGVNTTDIARPAKWNSDKLLIKFGYLDPHRGALGPYPEGSPAKCASIDYSILFYAIIINGLVYWWFHSFFISLLRLSFQMESCSVSKLYNYNFIAVFIHWGQWCMYVIVTSSSLVQVIVWHLCSAEPLPEQMLTYCQLNPREQTFLVAYL